MAATTASVNTVGGSEISAPIEHVLPKANDIKTQRFKKVMQHYITNSGNSMVPKMAVENVSYDCYYEGWCHLNYTSTRASMNQGEVDALMLSAKKYRVKAQGYDIKRINCIQQNVTVQNATTTINSSYQSAPSIMLFKDADDDLYERTFNANVVMTDTQFNLPVWRDPAAVSNDTYSTPFAATAAHGALTEVKTVFPNMMTVVDNPSNFSLMHGGDVEFLTAGKTHSHTWVNPNAEWHSPNMRSEDAGAGESPFITEVDIISNTVEITHNAATGVMHPNAVPQMHLLRVPPVHDLLGPIVMLFELLVEYWVEIEWMEGRYFGSLNHGTADLFGKVFVARKWYQVNLRKLDNTVRNVPSLHSNNTRDELQKGKGPAKKRKVDE